MLDYLTHLLIVGLIWAVLALSLNLQYGLAGLTNYGQVWFFAIGAYTSAIFFRNGLPFLGEPFVAMVAAAVGAWFIAQPTRRLSQDYWALVTFGVAEVFRLIMVNERWIAGGSIGTMGISTIASPRTLAGILMGLALAVFLVNERIARSAFGRVIRIIREDEVMAASLGRDVYSFQVRTLMLGGAVAALSGVAYAHYFSFVDPDAFLPIETFSIWMMLILGGRGNNFGVAIGALVLESITESGRFIAGWTHLSSIVIADLRQMIFGLLLVLIVLYRRDGIFPERKRIYPLSAAQGPESTAPVTAHEVLAAPRQGKREDSARRPGPLLQVQDVKKHFGGIEALAGVTMQFRSGGGVTGIIGPNGSGKSTLFNVVSGVVPMDSGSVYVNERRLDTRRPDLVAHQGVVRTFQIPKIAKRVTVLENLLAGPMGQRGERLTALFSPLTYSSLCQDEVSHLKRAEDVLRLLDLHQMSNAYAGELSGGQLKLLSLGLALMTESQVLLLDEPTAGVNPVVISRITRTLRELCAHGRTLVCIEHNMEVIAGMCDTVYVLDAGRVIMHGTPHDVRRDPAVIAAYVGTLVKPVRCRC